MMVGLVKPKRYVTDMMIQPLPDRFESRRLRLVTLIRLRWLAVGGQTLAVLVIAYGLGFPMPVSRCFALIALSAWLNLFLSFRYPSTLRLQPKATFGLLAFDILQLAGLLFLTGGISNPFATLMIVPAVISASSLPLRLTLTLSAVVVACVTILAVFHLPLPWVSGEPFVIPPYLKAGIYFAILSSLAFTVVYARRVAEEARQLSDALAATELVLQREQHFSALDGLAAAAAHELGTPLATIHLVAKELDLALSAGSPHKEDVELIRSQTQRCREILQRLSSLSAAGEVHLANMPLTSLVEEVIAPHRDFGITITQNGASCDGDEPVGRRNPGIIYGLGNLVENAVDFANTSVDVEWGWDRGRVSIRIADDGPGFPADMLAHIGEPYAKSRQLTPRNGGGGMGLGLFIAKTLLERSGAEINVRNRTDGRSGADIHVEWPRSAMDMTQSRSISPQTLTNAPVRAS
jgi:two-component system, sensor histidine kinase RegB